MGKGIKFGALAAVAAVVIVVILFACTTRVPAGYVAVQYNINGGVKDEVLTQGWHLVAPTTKTTLYTVGLEQSYMTQTEDGDSKGDDSFSASSSEGKSMQIDLTFTYQYQPENVTAVFNRFKGQSGKEVRDSFIKPNIVSWSKEVLARYKVSNILGAERTDINVALTKYLSERFAKYGITISNVSLINIEVDKDTQKAISAKIKAQQQAETQKIQNQTAIDKATAEAEVKRTEAKAKADAQLIQAEAEAKANKEISNSLTKELIEHEKIAKWNGDVPKVSGSGSTIVDTRDIAK